MRLLGISGMVLMLVGCGTTATEQKLREAETRAAEAEKKLAAIEQKMPPATAPTVAPVPAPVPTPTPAAAPAKQPPPAPRVIPAGSAIVVRTTSMLSTKTLNAGDSFVAHLEQPLMAGGSVVAPKGSQVTGVVSTADDGGRVKGRASMVLTLTSVTDAAGRVHRIGTSASTHVAKSGVKKDAVKTGIASGVGAAIGAIAGGGKGAAIGAGAGAGAGAGVVLATRGPAAEVPAESVLRFTLARALRVP
jgi:hypothetical protein